MNETELIEEFLDVQNLANNLDFSITISNNQFVIEHDTKVSIEQSCNTLREVRLFFEGVTAGRKLEEY